MKNCVGQTLLPRNTLFFVGRFLVASERAFIFNLSFISILLSSTHCTYFLFLFVMQFNVPWFFPLDGVTFSARSKNCSKISAVDKKLLNQEWNYLFSIYTEAHRLFPIRLWRGLLLVKLPVILSINKSAPIRITHRATIIIMSLIKNEKFFEYQK